MSNIYGYKNQNEKSEKDTATIVITITTGLNESITINQIVYTAILINIICLGIIAILAKNKSR